MAAAGGRGAPGVAARMPRREQPREHEQADARGGDLGQRAEADHRAGEAEVGGEEQAGERLGAMLRSGDLRDRRDRALEHQTAAGADDDVTGQEYTKAWGRQPYGDRQQAKPGQQRRDRRGQQLLRGARSGQRLRQCRRREHRERDSAGQRVRGLMQRSGEEARRKRGQ